MTLLIRIRLSGQSEVLELRRVAMNVVAQKPATLARGVEQDALLDGQIRSMKLSFPRVPEASRKRENMRKHWIEKRNGSLALALIMKTFGLSL